MSSKTWITLVILGLIGVACGTQPGTDVTPARSICAGVDAEMGGCEERQPEFAATDCEGVGREFGAQLEEWTMGIVEGPESVDGQARSVRLLQAMVLVSSRANAHLKEIGLHADCDVPEFLSAAEDEFTPKLRDSVGGASYDGDPVATYEEWLAEVSRMLRIIDAEEVGS
jgi:hypothetical protein